MTSRDGSALPAPIWGILLLQTGSGTWEEQPALTSSNALGGADAVQPVQVQYQVGSGHSLTYYPGYPSWAAWYLYLASALPCMHRRRGYFVLALLRCSPVASQPFSVMSRLCIGKNGLSVSL